MSNAHHGGGEVLERQCYIVYYLCSHDGNVNVLSM